MTSDEFYPRYRENRRLVQSLRPGLRPDRRAWIARASIADGTEGATAPPTQGDLWRSDEALLPVTEPGEPSANGSDGTSAGGRVVGRIAGGRIIPL